MDNTNRAPMAYKTKSHEIFRSTASTIDIPGRRSPHTKQQPTGLLFASPAARPCCSNPFHAQKRKTRTQRVLVFLGAMEGTRTARPSHRRGKQQPGGLLFSARGSPSRNVYRGSCGSKDFMAFCFVSHGCTVGVIHVRLCRALYCIAIGFRCPLVLAALLGQPVHQELCYRHGGRRPSTATPIRASFCRRTGACRSLSQLLFRISRNQGVTHTTLQAKSCANERSAALWILPGRALENGAPCSMRQVRHLAQRMNRRFCLTIRKIKTIITMR